MYTDKQNLLECLSTNLSELNTSTKLFPNQPIIMHVPVQLLAENKCTYLLCVSCCLCIILIIAVTVVPSRSMWFSRTKIQPAKLCFTVLVTTDHVITTAIFLNCDVAFGTFLCVSCNPIRSFTVIITLFNPLLQPLFENKNC